MMNAPKVKLSLIERTLNGFARAARSKRGGLFTLHAAEVEVLKAAFEEVRAEERGRCAQALVALSITCRINGSGDERHEFAASELLHAADAIRGGQ